MSKKKYSIPIGISSEIGTTLELVKNNIGTLNYKIVPIDAIEFDPDNPRDLAITRDDLPEGPKITDPLYKKKMAEFESLKQTADTIKKYGVRNAVEIYKYGTSYRLIHGERRCLSSILAGKTTIPAKILDEKPNDLDIRLLQLIENIQREDLSLHETLNNIQQVIKEYKKNVDANIDVDSVFLESLINRSKTHCLNIISILNGPEELKLAIKNGEVRSLEKAAIIAKAKTDTQRCYLLKSCLEGASLKQLKQSVIQQKILHKFSTSIAEQHTKRPGKQASKINLGTTKNKAVITKLIQSVIEQPLYSKFKDQFNMLTYDDFGSYSKAFSQLILIMEKIEKDYIESPGVVK